MSEPLLAPLPRPVARFNLDAADSPAPSPASTPSAGSPSSALIAPPPASPARAPLAGPSSSSSANNGGASSLFRYSDSDDDDGPIASTSSYVHGSQYPPHASGSDSLAYGPGDDSEDWDTGDRPLMEGIAFKGLRRASLDLRGEERRLKEMELDAEAAELPEWLSRGGGVLAGILNLSNSVLGAGIIGALILPRTLSEPLN